MSNFAADGYMVVDLSETARAEVALARGRIRSLIGCELEEAGHYYQEELLALQSECRTLVRDMPHNVIEEDRETLVKIVGEFKLQRNPYLRIARPGEITDNIGFHQDTWYGGDAREVSVWIPLVDVCAGAALKVKPGSHTEVMETEPAPSNIEKGTLGHALGFLYAPKRLKHPVEMTPVPLRCGQALVMSLGLLHGQEKNEASYTRWSMDCRAAPKSADIGARQGAY